MLSDFVKLLRTGTSVQSDGPGVIAATKAVFTLGPSCQDVDILCQLLEAGATCARCDLTWGTLEYHVKSLNNLQTAMHRTRKLCAVIVDTLGRECLANNQPNLDSPLRPIYGRKLSAQPRDKVVLTTREVVANSQNDWLVPVSHPEFPATCTVGETLVLGEYLAAGSEKSSLRLTVADISETDVVCIAQNKAQMEGLLTIFPAGRKDAATQEGKGLPPLSALDVDSLTALAMEFEIDFLCLSFTSHARDIQAARTFLASVGLDKTQVLAKLETGQALFQFHSIAEEADGIVLSRGKLGLDVRAEKMALIQRAIISNCNTMGKPVLVSRVLDSLSYDPCASRAELTDGSTAVMDGCDAFLLGAETARGSNPVNAVAEALHICQKAERCFDYKGHFDHMKEDLAAIQDEGVKTMEGVAAHAAELSESCNAKLIVVIPLPGMGTGLLSKYRPRVPVMNIVVPTLKFSDNVNWSLEGQGSARQCLVHRGLIPFLAQPSSIGESLLAEAVAYCLKNDMVASDDQIVVVQKGEDGFAAKVIVARDVAQPSRRVQQAEAETNGVKPEQSLHDSPSTGHALQNGHRSMEPQTPEQNPVSLTQEETGDLGQTPQAENTEDPSQHLQPDQHGRTDASSYLPQAPGNGHLPPQHQSDQPHAANGPQTLQNGDSDWVDGGGQPQQQWEQAPEDVHPTANGYEDHSLTPPFQGVEPDSGHTEYPRVVAASAFQGQAARGPSREPSTHLAPQRSDAENQAARGPSREPSTHLAPQRSNAESQAARGPSREPSTHLAPQRSNAENLESWQLNPPADTQEYSRHEGPQPLPQEYPRQDSFQLERQASGHSVGGSESVSVLVERARQVINRRLEQAHSMDHQHSLQKPYPYATSNGNTAATPEMRKAPSSHQVRGPVSPDVWERMQRGQGNGPSAVPYPDYKTHQNGPLPQDQRRDPRSRRELGHRSRPQVDPRIMRTSDVAQYRGDNRILNTSGDVDKYLTDPRTRGPSRDPNGYAQDSRIYNTAGDLDQYRNDTRVVDHTGDDSRYLTYSLDESTTRDERHQEAPQRQYRGPAPARDTGRTGVAHPQDANYPRHASAAPHYHVRENPSYRLEDKPVTIEQAREILGSLSRSSSLNDVRVRGDYEANGYREPQRNSLPPQGNGYGPGKPRERDFIAPDENHSQWFEAIEQRGRAPRPAAYNTSAFSSHAHEYLPETAPISAPSRQTKSQAPKQRESVRHQEAQDRGYENVAKPGRATQATQAARVLHQAGLNLIRQAALAGVGSEEDSELQVSRGVPKGKATTIGQETLLPTDYAADSVGEESGLRGLVSQTLPDSFSQTRQTTTWQKIPRVVGGRVVPGLSPAPNSRLSLGRITRREAASKRWNPSGPVIPEGFVKHDPLPKDNGVVYDEGTESEQPSSLKGPSSQSVPVMDVQRQAAHIQQQQQQPQQTSKDDSSIDTRSQPKYTKSIMNSNPDIYLHKQDRTSRKAQPPQSKFSRLPEPGQEGMQEPMMDPQRPPQAIRQQGARENGMGRPPSGQHLSRNLSGYTAGNTISRQTSAPYEGSDSEMLHRNRMNGEIHEGSMAGRSENYNNLPSQSSTAEELMRDYLVGEGIKKAHFRALHPKAPKKTKTGFFKSLFGKKSKTEN